ncbi:MAG: DUF1028 domain-containing protein [Flavobacterium sp.]
MKSFLSKLILSYLLCTASVSGQYINNEPFAHTYSIVAYDPHTGDMGIAVQSHWFSVGTSVSWGEAGVGLVATQAVVNFSFGPRGLAMLKEGIKPQIILDSLLKTDPMRDMRQVAIMDNQGNIAVSTGKNCVRAAGHSKGQFYSVQANLVQNPEVWKKMSQAYENTNGALGERLLAALQAAEDAGGDIRGSQSASLLIVRRNPTGKIWLDRKVDLRVDDSEAPLKELKRLYNVRMAYENSNLGNYHLMKGNKEEAHQYYRAAQKLYPQNGEMLFWYAVELANAGDEKAVGIFKEVFAINDNWQTVVLPRIIEAGILNAKADLINKISIIK